VYQRLGLSPIKPGVPRSPKPPVQVLQTDDFRNPHVNDRRRNLTLHGIVNQRIGVVTPGRSTGEDTALEA